MLDLKSPGRLKHKVQELRAAATIGQAKLKNISIQSAKNQIKEDAKTNHDSSSSTDYAFQAPDGKLIFTSKFKDLFTQYTTIFDATEKRLPLVPLPRETLAEVEE